jgi:hypothetical protein
MVHGPPQSRRTLFHDQVDGLVHLTAILKVAFERCRLSA